jgi:hypothetical protein
MTTPTQPTPAQQAEAFREEIRNAFDLLHVEIAELRAALEQMRDGLAHAAQPAPAQGGTFGEMVIDTIVMTTDENGKPVYKAKGEPFQKFGVRVWDEVLPALGIDPATLKPGKNTITPTRARVLLGETTNRETGEKGIGPRKVTGRA